MATLNLHVARVAGSVKVAGTLEVSESLLKWKQIPPESDHNLEFSYQALTGALQKAKAKPQVRLPTLSGPLVLEFASMEERDMAIDKLTPLIAASRPATQRAIEPTGPLAATKKELLQADPDLNSLYTELVRSGILRDADFWNSRQDILYSKTGTQQGGRQVAGISSAMLTQLKPSANGTTQVTMTITPQFIQQVFAEKPYVHRAYTEHVPHTMDAEAFWTRFAKYEMAMQERRKPGNKPGMHEPDALFAKPVAVKSSSLDSERVHPTVNLAADGFDGFCKAGDGYAEQSRNAETIAWEMNQHSAVVLQGPGVLLAGAQDHAGPSDVGSQQTARYWQELQPSGLDDLRATQAESTEALHIKDPRRYFERGASGLNGASGEVPSSHSQADPFRRCGEVSHNDIDVMLGLQLDSHGAELVLDDMRQEGTRLLPAHWVSSSLSLTSGQLVPEMQTLLRREALVANELLRHFWACLPVRTSAVREKKATKLKEALEKHYTKLDHMQEATQTSDRVVVTQLLRPVRQAVDAALEAYQTEIEAA